ncbi:MAG TPA: class E sortase, partial [Thermomonospora sp.]|nr:class E sortase [Thermomonospora sp.]
RRAFLGFLVLAAAGAFPEPVASAVPAPVAMLEIPGIDPPGKQPVHEGVSAASLSAGVGHYPGTALPGEPGNTVLLGHRTLRPAPFRALDRLRRGAEIRLYAGGVRHAYRVESVRVTTPADGGVLAAVPFDPAAEPAGRFVTLVTCHPKGSDEFRLVVVARSTAAEVNPAWP